MSHLPFHPTRVTYRRPSLAPLGQATRPLHLLLLLSPGRGVGAHRDAPGLFLTFHSASYLNGHNFAAQEFNQQGVPIRQHDYAFLSVAAPQALQAGADRFTRSAEDLQKELGVVPVGKTYLTTEPPKMCQVVRQVWKL